MRGMSTRLVKGHHAVAPMQKYPGRPCRHERDDSLSMLNLSARVARLVRMALDICSDAVYVDGWGGWDSREKFFQII